MKLIALSAFLLTLSLAHGATVKRCANLFDESCANGGLVGANRDDDWLTGNGVGKRCANLFDESCANGGLVGANTDDDYLGGNAVGRRNVPHFFSRFGRGNEQQEKIFKSLANFFNRAHIATVKRCANLFDESCVNGGLPGASGDDDWLTGGSPGKR